MLAFAKIQVLGHVGRNPEKRYLPNGEMVFNFSIAVSRRSTNPATGEQRESTAWYRCSAYGKLAETVSDIVNQGDRILVTGIPVYDESTGSPRIWNRQDGTPSTSFELRLVEVNDLEKKSEKAVAAAVGQEDDEMEYPF